MDRNEAQQFVAELCEAVNDGGWGEVLQVGLDNESIEILRVLRQLNGDITKLEAREKELSDALVTRLMPFDFDDGSEPEPAGANASGANGLLSIVAQNRPPENKPRWLTFRSGVLRHERCPEGINRRVGRQPAGPRQTW